MSLNGIKITKESKGLSFSGFPKSPETRKSYITVFIKIGQNSAIAKCYRERGRGSPHIIVFLYGSK